MVWKATILIIISFFSLAIFSKNPKQTNEIFETKNISSSLGKIEKNINIPSFGHKIFELHPKNIRFSSGCLASGEKLVINGPLFGEDYFPVGGYVSGGRQMKKFFSIKNKSANFGLDNGIFGYGLDGKFYLDYSSSYKNKKFLWAFQNGPILVLRGKNIRKENSARYPRAGIGHKNGKLVAIFTPQFLTLKEFGDLFIQNGVENAIYLDGGSPVGYEDQSGKFGNLNPSAVKLHFF